MPAKTGTSGLLEGVDPKIFDLLGIKDNKDIDLSTYKTLLREKMMAGRMTDTGVSSEDTEALTNEWKRVKSIKEEPQTSQARPQTPKTPTPTSKDSAETGEKKSRGGVSRGAPAGTKIDPKKLLPPAGGDIVPASGQQGTAGAEDTSAEVGDVKKSVEELKSVLTSGFSKIENNLQSMVDALNKGNQVTKKGQEKARISEEKGRKAGREASIETKEKEKPETMAEKATKPVMGFFEMILNFFKNILMGTVVVGLLKLLTNPKKFLDPIFKVINGVISALNWLIALVVDAFRNPINLLITGLNSGIGFIVDMLNKALSIIPGVKEDLIPKPQLPEIPAVPAIPKIPLQEESAPPVQAAAEGGVVGAENSGVIREGQVVSGDESPEANEVEKLVVILPGTPEDTLQMKGGGKIAKVDTPKVDMPKGDMPKMGIDLKGMGDNLTSVVKEKLMGGQGGGGSAPGLNVGGKAPGLDVGAKAPGLNVGAKAPGLNVGSKAPGMNVGSKAPGLQVAARGGEVDAKKISAKKGGPVTSQSGIKVTGAGKDTQLVAAQPGEIVMSKKAVDKIGADKLLAMNKSGGGDNKPRYVKSNVVQRAEGGGTVLQTIKALQGGGMVDDLFGAYDNFPLSSSQTTVNRSIPPPSPKATVVDLRKTRKPSRRPPQSTGAAADQKVPQPFAPFDSNNTTYNVIKGMYNIVGG